MSQFLIENAHSGETLGVYEAETEEQALDAMARDAGYADYAAACEVTPVVPGEIVVVKCMEDRLFLVACVALVGAMIGYAL